MIEKFPGSDHVAYAKERVAALEPRVPRLTIKLADGAPDGTKVTLDGQEVAAGDIGNPLPVDPGQHVIDVTAPGRETTVYKVRLVEGEKREAIVRSATLLTHPGEQGDASDTKRHPGDQSASTTNPLGEGRIVALIVAGAGLAAGAAAGIAFRSARNAKESADKAAREGRASDMAHDRTEQESWHSASIVLGAVSAAAVGSAAVLWILAKPPQDTAPRSSRPRVMPVLGNRAAIIAIEGIW